MMETLSCSVSEFRGHCWLTGFLLLLSQELIKALLIAEAYCGAPIERESCFKAVKSSSNYGCRAFTSETPSPLHLL
ncbi:hypothetical protein MTO96_027831 [Rhipicephalus appendiculatus]